MFLPASVIQGNPPLYEENGLWEALSVVSQKWSFPTALLGNLQTLHSQHPDLVIPLSTPPGLQSLHPHRGGRGTFSWVPTWVGFASASPFEPPQKGVSPEKDRPKQDWGHGWCRRIPDARCFLTYILVHFVLCVSSVMLLFVNRPISVSLASPIKKPIVSTRCV